MPMLDYIILETKFKESFFVPLPDSDIYPSQNKEK
jgi:hypothetical protein